MSVCLKPFSLTDFINSNVNITDLNYNKRASSKKIILQNDLMRFHNAFQISNLTNVIRKKKQLHKTKNELYSPSQLFDLNLSDTSNNISLLITNSTKQHNSRQHKK